MIAYRLHRVAYGDEGEAEGRDQLVKIGHRDSSECFPSWIVEENEENEGKTSEKTIPKGSPAPFGLRFLTDDYLIMDFICLQCHNTRAERLNDWSHGLTEMIIR